MKRLVPIAICLLLVLAAEARVDAYLDPGSGSMLVQLLLGGVAGRRGHHEARVGAIQRHLPLLESEADEAE